MRWLPRSAVVTRDRPDSTKRSNRLVECAAIPALGPPIASKNSIKAGVRTVNDEATMAQMLKMGIDRVYTDAPRRLLALRARRTNMQAP